MNERRVLQSLIWKDIATIKPLVLLGVAAILALNLLSWLIWQYFGVDKYTRSSVSVSLWLIIPNLVTFGIPALLVGNEQDTGTIDWLRTLPIKWQQITAAKFLVAIGAVAVVWILASLVVGMHSLGWPESRYASATDLLEPESVLKVLYLNLLLLLLGFVTSYGIRSPVAGIVALIPLYYLTTVFLFVVFESLSDRGEITWPIAMWATGTLVFAWLWGRVLARRRLLLPARNRSISLAGARSEARSPVRSLGARPSPTVSLLWQQCRQTGLLCAGIVATTLLSAFLFLQARDANPGGLVWLFGTLSPMFLLLGASWLGASVFYGDNVRQRCGFLADRGISPTQIWWTRMAPPAAALLLMLVAIGLIAAATLGRSTGGFTDIAMGYLIAVIILFAFGQLVSQWVTRPVLAFLAAPAYAAISMSPVIRFYELNWLNANYLIVTALVLLLTTWRLTQRWLEAGSNTGYTARVIGYTALAVLLPCFLSLGKALLSMPVYGIFGPRIEVAVADESQSSAIEPLISVEQTHRGELP